MLTQLTIHGIILAKWQKPVAGKALITMRSDNMSPFLHAELLSPMGENLSSGYFYTEMMGKDEAQFSFDRKNLPAGIYMLVVKDGERLIGSSKLVVVQKNN